MEERLSIENTLKILNESPFYIPFTNQNGEWVKFNTSKYKDNISKQTTIYFWGYKINFINLVEINFIEKFMDNFFLRNLNEENKYS